MGGKKLKADYDRSPKKPTGLFPRLGAHASGRLSGDQFCVYVFAWYIAPHLTEQQRQQMAAGEKLIDGLTKAYIRDHFRYRYVATADGPAALALEREVQRGALKSVGKPLINPL
ncbi:hypothetical protein A5650_10820 [Mycobacterium sp. 1164985.4]|nr:hypothetical protein A5650_10820 [Mycobacterium sp. 1164985.4]